MAKSLQEQLLQTGVAKPKQAKKARREKTRRDQQARRNTETPTDDQALAHDLAAADAAKQERDRHLNAERNARREAQERDQTVAQIIKRNRVAPDADTRHSISYNYTIGKKIRRITVSNSQRLELADGRLAIVRHRGDAALVPAAIAERLQSMIPDRIWQAQPENDSPDPDDPYADFPVPDDLMW